MGKINERKGKLLNYSQMLWGVYKAFHQKCSFLDAGVMVVCGVQKHLDEVFACSLSPGSVSRLCEEPRHDESHDCS